MRPVFPLMAHDFKNLTFRGYGFRARAFGAPRNDV